MKVFIPLLCYVVTLALAEPPVGDGYPATNTFHHHDGHNNDDHHTDHQPSKNYGPPSTSSDHEDQNGYNYDTPNISSTGRQPKFPPATVRVSFNQRFSSLANSNQGYDYPARRGSLGKRISEEYAAPNARSSSEAHGPYVSARTLSTEYGMPDARSSPSQEYGAPVLATRSPFHSESSARNIGNNLADDHSTSAKSNFQIDSSDSYNAPSKTDAMPFSKSALSSHTIPSLTYGAPSYQSQDSTRNSEMHKYDSISHTYGVPNERDLSENNEGSGAPSQEYGVPSSRTNLMTTAVTTAYQSARSSPSSSYLPASRSVPSEQYGIPEQRNSGQGYDYAQARALEELQNQEPASYDFGYQIEDQESGSDFGHSETREEGSAQGSYFVVLPDGTKQTVEYEADERGFQPRISVEPVARANGPY